jgi:hypothetical protein
MGSRKKKYVVRFKTTASMAAIMPIVQQLADSGSVENLSVDEVLITPANALEA